MRQQELLKYIQSPELLNRSHISELEKLVEQFPYFQPAYLLLSIASKQHDSLVFQKYFKQTAIICPNRRQLYALLHREPVKATEVKLSETESLLATATEHKKTTALLDEQVIAQPAQVEKINNAVQQPVDENTERLRLIEERLAEIEKQKVISEVPVPEPERETTPANPELKETSVQEEKTVLSSEELNTELQTIKRSAEYIIENEIEKSVVNAFVEKEVLKTHTAGQKEEPFTEGSFNQWLQFFGHIKQAPVSPLNSVENNSNKEQTAKTEKPQPPVQKNKEERAKKMEIIDKIIEKNPSHIRLDPAKAKIYSADKNAKDSLLESEHLVTETLAKIYALQGNINKAIRAYEILSLKYPNKSVYFASLIKELKKN
ncbi:MAG: hypothetical protein QM534_10060 [Sediminibacterium sp.]|nr:hypothetical protein [Sediminibacterium sp.]